MDEWTDTGCVVFLAHDCPGSIPFAPPLHKAAASAGASRTSFHARWSLIFRRSPLYLFLLNLTRSRSGRRAAPIPSVLAASRDIVFLFQFNPTPKLHSIVAGSSLAPLFHTYPPQWQAGGTSTLNNPAERPLSFRSLCDLAFVGVG